MLSKTGKTLNASIRPDEPIKPYKSIKFVVSSEMGKSEKGRPGIYPRHYRVKKSKGLQPLRHAFLTQAPGLQIVTILP